MSSLRVLESMPMRLCLQLEQSRGDEAAWVAGAKQLEDVQGCLAAVAFSGRFASILVVVKFLTVCRCKAAGGYTGLPCCRSLR